MYADDTIIYFTNPSSQLIEQKLNATLQLLSSWLKSNKLTLNIYKNKSMLIGSSNKL